MRTTMTLGLGRSGIARRVFVVDELPRNTMGKVQKNVLRERFKDAFVAKR